MLEVWFLGQQRVVVDGEHVASAVPPRTLGLMALLALHSGQDLPRSRAASAFWPDSTDEQALTNLRRELHALKHRLPEFAAGIQASGRCLRWEPGPNTRCDVARFVALAARAQAPGTPTDDFALFATEAVEVFSGELLPAAGEEWLVDERARLHRQCVELIDGLLSASASAPATGEARAKVTALAARRIDLEPFEERGYQRLMALQAEAGDRAAAVTTFHRCASTLERELGVAPDPETVRLYQSLISADPTMPATTSGAVRSGVRVPLVGRENELGTLHNRWSQALRGGGGLHLVVGEPGVGKTRLLSEFSGAAERHGVLVARARCYSARSRLSMAPLAEWLAAPALHAHQSSLPLVWQTEVARLVPTHDYAEGPEAMTDAWQRHRFFEGLATAVLAPDRPTLLILDDIQWCDGETLAWLQFFLRRATGRPVLVVATGREEEFADNDELTVLMAALRAENLLTKAEIVPLSPEQAGELARLAGSEAADDEGMFAVTGGYPLFVIESVRAGAQEPALLSRALEGSQLVQAVLDGRLDQLSERARGVAGLAAVLGHEFNPELLERASDLPAGQVIDGLDELWRRRIIVHHRQRYGRHPGYYDFSHDLLRDATLRRIPPPRLGAMHRRVGEALEQETGADSGTLAGRIADHFEQAGLGIRALPFHERAAEIAEERYALDTAIDHYRAACRLLSELPESDERDRHELRLRQAVSAPINARYGFSAPALEDELQRSLSLAERVHDSRLELLSLVGLFSAYVVQGRIEDAYRVSRRALASSVSEPEVLGQAHFAVAGSATMLGRLDEGLEHFDRVPSLTIDLPPSIVGTRPEVHSMAWQAHALWLTGQSAEAHDHVSWAINRARKVDHPFSLAVALAYAAMLAQFEENVDEVMRLAGLTSELCAKHGFRYYGDWSRILAGWAAGGHRGLDLIDEGLAALDSQGAMIRRSYYLTLRADLQLSVGDLASATISMQLAQDLARSHHDVWWLPEVLRRLAALEPPGSASDLLREAHELALEQRSVALASRIESDLHRSESAS